jgi:tetratricopeptide (TPR) repeat protein
MVDLHPDLQSYARAAHVRWLTGDLNGAVELMQLAATASSPNDPEAAAWAFTRLALYQLQSGTTNRALQSCEAALALQSDYAPAIFARGRTLLAMNRSSEAVAELKQAASLNPLPEYQWALADAVILTGNRDEAAKIESQIAAGATEDPRTLSLFLATRKTDVDRAVLLAQQELTNRRDVFTLDAVAWALAAAERPSEAQQYVSQILAQRTADPRIYFHAGVIAALNRNYKQAKQWLEQAATAKQMLLPGEQVELDSWRQEVRRKTPRTH